MPETKTLEDLAKAVEASQSAFIAAADKATASAAQAAADLASRETAMQQLHSDVGALVSAALADDPTSPTPAPAPTTPSTTG